MTKKIFLYISFIFLLQIQISYASDKKITFGADEVKENESVEETEEYDYFYELLKVDTKPRFGVFGGFEINSHYTNFKQLPGVDNCCSLFESGNGAGVTLGLIAQFFINNSWSYGSKLFFGKLNGVFSDITNDLVLVAGKPVNGKIENKLNISNNILGVSPFINYRLDKISSDLYSSLGLKIATPIAATFSQYEKLLEPEVGSFINGRRVRNIKYGDLPEKSSVLFAATIGLSYELPLNREKTLRIAPEVFYTYWLNSPVKKLSWNISQLTFGAAIKYIQPPPPPPPPAEPVLPYLPDLPQPINKNIFAVNITATSKVANLDNSTNLDNNYKYTSKHSSEAELTVEDFTYINLKPLLNYIFFDENSYELPRRYNMFSRKQADEFSIKDLQRLDALDTYYQILNIIGYRMRENQKNNIELVGTNSGIGEEKDNLSLSEKRAITIKNYLVDVWQIDSGRIKIIARNLPNEPTRSSIDDSKFGDEENQRVEIISSDTKITESILSFDTLKVIRASDIVFTPEVKSTFGIKNWELVVEQKKSTSNNTSNSTNLRNINNKDSLKNNIKNWAGTGYIPKEISWDAKNISSSNIDANSNLQYFLNVKDSIGQQKNSTKQDIKINRITVDAKRQEMHLDTEYENYSLILFDFGSKKLASEHKQVVDFIKNRVKDNSVVTISGYTDALGEESVNERIALERAKAVSQRLQIRNATVLGIGERELLYDNNLPEGRFYCRTVTITIETPINKE